MTIIFVIFWIIILACIGLASYTVFWLLKTIDKMSELIKAENLQEIKNEETKIDPKEIESENYSSAYSIDEETAKWLAVKLDFTR